MKTTRKRYSADFKAKVALADNFLASVQLVSIRIWLRHNESVL